MIVFLRQWVHFQFPAYSFSPWFSWDNLILQFIELISPFSAYKHLFHKITSNLHFFSKWRVNFLFSQDNELIPRFPACAFSRWFSWVSLEKTNVAVHLKVLNCVEGTSVWRSFSWADSWKHLTGARWISCFTRCSLSNNVISRGVSRLHCALINAYFTSEPADQRGRMVRKGWQASGVF